MPSAPILAEFGIVALVGRNGVEQLLGVVADVADKRLPEVARACVAALGTQPQTLKVEPQRAHTNRVRRTPRSAAKLEQTLLLNEGKLGSR
jgi:hypothetical protein